MNFIEGINWYAIQTKSKQEDLVAYYLSQLGMEILNPKQMKEKFVWGRPKIVTEPLFPGYMFAKFNPARFLHTIQYTRGVRKVLHFGMTLLRIEEEIIQGIRERLNSDDCVELYHEPFSAGDAVAVTEGPFNGLRGIFRREMNGQKRVVLLLDILGAPTEVIIDRRFLNSAASHQGA